MPERTGRCLDLPREINNQTCGAITSGHKPRSAETHGRPVISRGEPRRLTNVTSPAGAFGYVLGIQAPASPLVSRLLLPNGAYIRNAYDSIARLLSTKLVNSSGTVLDSQAYAYNQASQRIGETNLAGDFRDYTYDNSGQLLTGVGKEAGGVTNRLQEQMGYLYDPAGNLNQRTNNNLVETFTVNAANELSGVARSGSIPIAGTTTTAATNVTLYPSPGFIARTAILYADATFADGGWSAPSGSNSITAVAQDSYGRVATNIVILNLPSTNNYTYDANGNLLNDGNRNFSYDDQNLLIAVWVTNAWQSTFAYDGRLRRRIRREFTWSGGAWSQTNEVHYIYDGGVVVQERDINNLPTGTYTRGPDLSGTLQGAGGIGGLLARTDNGQSIARPSTAHAFYHADGNGNVSCLIYTNQQIAAHYLYDPFGNILSQSGPLANANLYRYSSEEYHSPSGLIIFPRRFYDPSLQRWINQDPLSESGGINLYGYVGNNPVNEIDLLGLYNPISGPGGAVGPGSGLADPSLFLPPSLLAPNNSTANGGGINYDSTSLVVGDLGLSQAAVQFGSGNAAVAENGSLYLRGLFGARGFNGNQWLKAAKIAKCAEKFAPPLAALSFGVDLNGVVEGEISPTKFGVNTAFTAVGFVAPPYGAIVAGSYFLTDQLYPGGAANAATEYFDYSANTIMSSYDGGEDYTLW